VASGADNAGTGWYCQTVRVRLARVRRYTRGHQCLKLRKRGTDSNLVDVGRDAVRGPDGRCQGQLRSRLGVPVGRPRGRSAAYSWRGCRGKAGYQADRSVSGEHGNCLVPLRATCDPHGMVGIAPSSCEGPRQGGGPVVVAGVATRRGGRESRPQGQGGQQVGRRGSGMLGERW
jgi:hypothetical protein